MRKIWISWELQRRSIELAKYFDCKLIIFQYSGLFRYPISIVRTIISFRQDNPDVIFVQNPSMILATIAVSYGKIFSVPVIVDRHTTFMLNREYKNTPSVILFKILHKFTMRYAFLTIVTNDYLANIVKKSDGRAFVLPDKIPQFRHEGVFQYQLGTHDNIFLISSFGSDEPIGNVLEAMELLAAQDIHLYISGNYNLLPVCLKDNKPSNVHFTGFLSDNEFVGVLLRCKIIMALTTSDYTMLCGCYEAVGAEKPLLTSNKNVLVDYFEGATFTDNSPEDIKECILDILNNYEQANDNMKHMKKVITKSWLKQSQDLTKIIDSAGK